MKELSIDFCFTVKTSESLAAVSGFPQYHKTMQEKQKIFRTDYKLNMLIV